MKVIISGCTGFIGAEVLAQALAHPDITSVVALSRRALQGPHAGNPKLKTVIMSDDDYINYPPHVLKELEGAQGCVWALGIALPKDLETNQRVNVDYPLAAASTLSTRLSSPPSGEKFRFALCSGMLVERDQARKLWFMDEERKARGRAESELVCMAAQPGSGLDAFVLRPSMVLSRGKAWVSCVMGPGLSVRVQDLAAALLESALRGGTPPIEECAELARRGARFLLSSP